MCNKCDDSCRQEKLGCKGCFYKRKAEYNDLLLTLINTDFLESACSEETANKYKQAIEELIYENIELKQKQIINKNFIPQQDNFYDYYNYIHKDKIKEKIEKYLSQDLTIYYGERQNGKTFQQAVKTEVIKILKELLEEK